MQLKKVDPGRPRRTCGTVWSPEGGELFGDGAFERLVYRHTKTKTVERQDTHLHPTQPHHTVLSWISPCCDCTVGQNVVPRCELYRALSCRSWVQIGSPVDVKRNVIYWRACRTSAEREIINRSFSVFCRPTIRVYAVCLNPSLRVTVPVPVLYSHPSK